MLLDVPCSNRKSFNVFIVFAKIIFSFLIYWFRKIKLLILCFEYKSMRIFMKHGNLLSIASQWLMNLTG